MKNRILSLEIFFRKGLRYSHERYKYLHQRWKKQSDHKGKNVVEESVISKT